ncbi:MAG: class I SAM-dependent methyltransferase [Oscillospiraceae bacterium]|jgi:23S rRNA (cytosine1962-C5)-methyltransferase|nr:class I SAM-dependent methyltransferase [Oscillospiraceae bacterium]
MRFAAWQDYELLDTSEGNRLERWANKILIRPDPQIIWKSNAMKEVWNKPDGIYHRSGSGGGNWQITTHVKDKWKISYKDLNFYIRTMGFKHTGVFPEQAVNWDLIRNLISKSDKRLNILNLFAYTGGATLACAKTEAKVCHVDSSKGMVLWAKENASISGISDDAVRWIVDDCVKFVSKEIRRGKKYDAIIMDPPSYGRGNSGEVWKIEKDLYLLLNHCAQILSENPKFFILNSYTTGLSPYTMHYMLSKVLKEKWGGKVSCSEIGLPVKSTGLILPSGSTAVWENI